MILKSHHYTSGQEYEGKESILKLAKRLVEDIEKYGDDAKLHLEAELVFEDQPAEEPKPFKLGTKK